MRTTLLTSSHQMTTAVLRTSHNVKARLLLCSFQTLPLLASLTGCYITVTGESGWSAAFSIILLRLLRLQNSQA